MTWVDFYWIGLLWITLSLNPISPWHVLNEEPPGEYLSAQQIGTGKSIADNAVVTDQLYYKIADSRGDEKRVVVAKATVVDLPELVVCGVDFHSLDTSTQVSIEADGEQSTLEVASVASSCGCTAATIGDDQLEGFRLDTKFKVTSKNFPKAKSIEVSVFLANGNSILFRRTVHYYPPVSVIPDKGSHLSLHDAGPIEVVPEGDARHFVGEIPIRISSASTQELSRLSDSLAPNEFRTSKGVSVDIVLNDAKSATSPFGPDYPVLCLDGRLIVKGELGRSSTLPTVVSIDFDLGVAGKSAVEISTTFEERKLVVASPGTIVLTRNRTDGTVLVSRQDGKPLAISAVEFDKQLLEVARQEISELGAEYRIHWNPAEGRGLIRSSVDFTIDGIGVVSVQIAIVRY